MLINSLNFQLIDIIDRPVPRSSTMPAWNYANYLQNSPVAILSPQQDPFMRCAMLAENHGSLSPLSLYIQWVKVTLFTYVSVGLSVDEYLTATASGPGLYTSTSRDAITAQYANSVQNQNHHLTPPPPPAPAPSPNPASPPVYRIPVPEEAVQPTPSPMRQQKRENSRRRREINFRQSSLRERDLEAERPKPSRSRSRASMREYHYDDICFDVWGESWRKF